MGAHTDNWRDWVAAQLTVDTITSTWTFCVYDDDKKIVGVMEYPGPDPDGFTTPQEFADWAVEALSDANLRLDGPWFMLGKPVELTELTGDYLVGCGLAPVAHAWARRVVLGRVPADGTRVPCVMKVSGDDPPLAIALGNYGPMLVDALADPDLADAPNEAMTDLLYAVRRLRQATAAWEEDLVAMWKDREGDNLSWTQLGIPLGVGRQAAKEYYQRILSDRLEGTTIQEVATAGMPVAS